MWREILFVRVMEKTSFAPYASVNKSDIIKESSSKSFYLQEQTCELVFLEHAPYWHLYTNGTLSQLLFTCEEDYKLCLNIVGICAASFQSVRILTFAVMSNHLHFIISGDSSTCLDFFKQFRGRLIRCLNKSGRHVDFSPFTPSIIGIDDIKSLRNEIVYVNRNGFVANQNVTPYSYYWGAGYLFFNTMLRRLLQGTPFNELKVRERKQISRSRGEAMYNGLRVLDGLVLPSSFVCVDLAESIFRNAGQYFTMLSKNYEAYSQIAKKLGETISVSDEEMYPAISALCFKKYNEHRPHLLSPKAKIEMAKVMHYDYNASNKQVQRILKLSLEEIVEMFPLPRQ